MNKCDTVRFLLHSHISQKENADSVYENLHEEEWAYKNWEHNHRWLEIQYHPRIRKAGYGICLLRLFSSAPTLHVYF